MTRRTSKAHGLALLLVAGGLAQAADAATFENLYTVTVEPQAAREPGAPSLSQADTLRLAMGKLLTRITGRREAGAYPELQSLVANASQYRTEYGQIDAERVRVGFNATNVSRALEALDWPIWGAERPLTLLWIAVDFGNGQRALLSPGQREPNLGDELDEFMRSVEDEVRDVADERGLPITFPLLDLEDQQAITFAEVWGGFDSLIARASERYRADAILVGRISVTDFGLDVRWNLIQGDRGRMIVATSVREGLDWLADEYAAEYSIAGGARVARLSILGVQSWADYLRVRAHLETLSVLESVDLEELAEGELTLRVTARGDNQQLERVLTLGGVLQLEGGAPQRNGPRGPGGFDVPGQSFPAGSSGFGANLVFRLAGSTSRR